MWTISSHLAADLAGPGPDAVEAYAELWQGGVRVATAEVVEGQVTDDASAAVRRSCSLTLLPLDALTPETEIVGEDRRFGDGLFGEGVFGDYRRRQMQGLLMPLLTEVRVYWRARLSGTDTWETVPLGRFLVDSPGFSGDPGDPALRVSGFDAASAIAAAAWDTPFVVPAGQNLKTALTRILTNRLPGVATSIPTTTVALPQLVYTPGYQDSTGDPWEDACALAALAGWDLWVNRQGVVCAGVPADPLTGVPVIELADAGTLIRATRTPTAADLVNTVVVYGEASGEEPVVAVVRDEHGPYGTETIGRVIAREHRSSAVTTYADAYNLGIALLREWSAVTDAVSLEAFPVPHLDAGDLAAVTSDMLDMTAEVYRVERVVTSLTPGSLASQVDLVRRIG
jgi:hypothetical protein